jgi:NAD(P)H-dependent flavin oxidoreductase YrpB (nitropropane dioxygenase family)
MISSERVNPLIIQGGMGVGVSSWELASAVARRGQLGVVSGTMLDTLFVRRLQDGDPGGHLHRATEAFPMPGVRDEIFRRYYSPSGRRTGTPYRMLPMYKQIVSDSRQRITILANFAEVWLAKEGHDGDIGINLLTKVQLPTLPSLYGAMLAGVDYVLMGAGIPREIPGALDALADHRSAKLRLEGEGFSAGEAEYIDFEPARHPVAGAGSLRRPRFLAIVSAASLAATLARKSNGRVDGFIVEGNTAGGHNAPPRGALRLDEGGEPIYGERDRVDLPRHALRRRRRRSPSTRGRRGRRR